MKIKMNKNVIKRSGSRVGNALNIFRYERKSKAAFIKDSQTVTETIRVLILFKILLHIIQSKALKNKSFHFMSHFIM